MNLKQALADTRDILEECHVEDAALEGEVLLRHVLGMSRAQLYLNIDSEFSPAVANDLTTLVRRRRQGEPSAYITGHREFFGLDFYVDHRVLIPRPETELIVEKALSLVGHNDIKSIADIGTGSGAIAISLAVNLPSVKVYATDISAAALEVVGINCRKHNVLDRICLLEGDLLEPLSELVDLIIANLPYVNEQDVLGNTTLGFEPELALNGGPDGLETIRRICRQALAKLAPGGCLLLEIGKGQGAGVVASLREAFPTGVIEIIPDLGGIERVVALYLTKNGI